GHGLLPVLDLRLAVLARHHDLVRGAGLERDPHGRVGGVHGLAAGPAGAVDVDPDVLRIDLDVDVVVDLRHDLHRGEGRVAPALGVEGAHPHEAVHAALHAEPAEGPVSPDDHLRVLDPVRGVVVGHDVEDLDVVAVAL